MNLKELPDYGRGLEMSKKQAKGIEKQEKLTQVAHVQTVKEEKQKPENKKCYRCEENCQVLSHERPFRKSVQKQIKFQES